MTLESLKSLVDRAALQWDHCRRQVREERDALEAAQQRLACVLTAQELVQGVAEKVQKEAHSRIAGIVTRCLKAIFGEQAYEFEIRFAQKRGRTEAQLLFIRDGNEYDDPPNQCSGGQCEVAAFALRLVCICLLRKRRFLSLDEPFKAVAIARRQAIKELLLTLAEELQFQMVLTTHFSEMAGGTVVELGD
jgi:DNA repair exonuclease SbcCD ATPase subunit